MDKKTVVVVVGPTASGKSKLAIDICKYLNGEVISADSMQIYKKMNIGTAKATLEEQQGIRHHLLDIVNPDENYSLESFLKDCENAVDDVISRGKLPVIAGGTGLYISSFVNGLQLTEAKVDENYRVFLETMAETFGNLTLKQLLFQVDKESFDKLKLNDRKRIIRALEVYRTTGKTITQINKDSSSSAKYNFIIFGLNSTNREFLYERINKRVDEMIYAGLIEEARALHKENLSMTALQAIGYKELFSYFNGYCTIEEAVEEIKKSSRNYAKRQITWFKKELNVTWIPIDEKNYEEILNFTINGIVKNTNICYNKE